jgi:hypothetical protein
MEKLEELKEKTLTLGFRMDETEKDIQSHAQKISDIEKTCLLKCSLGDNLKNEINQLKDKVQSLEIEFKKIPELVKKTVKNMFNTMVVKIVGSMILLTFTTLGFWCNESEKFHKKLITTVENTVRVEIQDYEKNRLAQENKELKEKIGQ